MLRKPTRAYLGAPVRRRAFRQHWNGARLAFDKDGAPQDWTPGVNAWTLRKMGAMHPDRTWWREEAMKALGAWEAENGPHEDKNLWNVLATAEGLKWFDGRCHEPQDGIEGQLEGFGK